MSGLAAAGGRDGDPPTPAGTSIMEAATALTLANGILAALVARYRHGIGQRVEVDLYSTAIALQCQEISAMVNQGQDWRRSAAGVGQAWLSAPFGVYRAADGWLAPVDKVAALLGVPGVDTLDPWSDRDTIKNELEKATVTRSLEELLGLLMPAGIWCSPVRTTAEAVNELRDQEHDMVIEVEHPTAGNLELIGCPIRLSETPWQLRYAPPLVGQHTQEVLSEVLSADRIAALRAEGAIG